MRFAKADLALPLAALLLVLTGCESDNPKHAQTAPPPAAMAPTLSQTPAPTAPTSSQATTSRPPAAAADPVPGMIAAAEQSYQAGLAEYKAGHLESAKQYFDQSVDGLMEGPTDIQSDERLRSEFDKVVDGVHTLELAALQEGDGFTEQKSEPAPIDEANSITFPTDPNVTAKAAAELQHTKSDLPLVLNDYVASYINYFTTRGRDTLENAWRRGGRYHNMITRILKEEGVPQDLFYLAQAESGFHPLAVSRVGARGMWQFMHYTAPGYGLQRNWWVDDRQDPEKATRAAARYLKDLYNQFGDWYLAMAAYNSGAGNVQRAVQRTGYADFWELYRRNVLPAETKNYVPIILAMTIIGKNPAQYGLTQIPMDVDEQLDHVTTDYAVDLRLVAETIDHPVEELADLNPSLVRRVTPANESYDLKLPAGTAQKFETAIAAIPEDKRVLWRYHHVAEGESLAEIARKYHTSTKAIAEVNHLESDDIQPDSNLVIPVAPERKTASLRFAKRPTRYKVRKGDTVLSVADDFGVPPDRLRRWNRLKGNSLRPGRSLLVYKPLSGDAPRLERVSRSRGKKYRGRSSAGSKTAKHHSAAKSPAKKTANSATRSASVAKPHKKRRSRAD